MEKVKASQLFDADDLLGYTASTPDGVLVTVSNDEPRQWLVEVIIDGICDRHQFSRKADAVKLVKSFGQLYF